MGIIEILTISLSLSADVFAVAVCKGLSMKKINYKKMLIIAIYFSLFQALMPFIGYLLGSTFESIITSIDHWIAVLLLGFIGFNMIKESFTKKSELIDDSVDFKSMIMLSLATNIDALAIGITFAFLKANLLVALLCIGASGFILSILGVIIGNKFGSKFGKKAEFVGGVVLILMGIKIVLEHLGVL